MILKERHPEPMHSEELKARFINLVREHGSIFNAVNHLRRMHRQ